MSKLQVGKKRDIYENKTTTIYTFLYSRRLPMCNKCALGPNSSGGFSSTYYKSFDSTRLSTTRKEAIIMKTINEDNIYNS